MMRSRYCVRKRLGMELRHVDRFDRVICSSDSCKRRLMCTNHRGEENFSSILSDLTDSQRRRILIEILKRDDLERIFKEADINQDGVVSPMELSKWHRRRFLIQNDDEETTRDESVGRDQLARIALQFSIPMIGFGFADNFIMIVAGEMIDSKIGATLAISTMAAAGLGNLVSAVAGGVLSSIIERASHTMGLSKPNLSNAQKASRVVKLTTAVSSASGIAVGCLFGMIPLCFM